MSIAVQDILQKCKVLLCFRKTPVMTPTETCQIAHQISIRSRRKAQDFLVLLVVDYVFSYTFLVSLDALSTHSNPIVSKLIS